MPKPNPWKPVQERAQSSCAGQRHYPDMNGTIACEHCTITHGWKLPYRTAARSSFVDEYRPRSTTNAEHLRKRARVGRNPALAA